MTRNKTTTRPEPGKQNHPPSAVAMEFTGERFTPECEREIWYEHYHRYALARQLVADKQVLDAACGEGYGASLLSAVAASVVGVDVDSKTIQHATARYASQENGGDDARLKFVQASCGSLPFADNSFDVVVSFETLEHLGEQEQMLSEFNRVLKDGGFLIISTPDKAVYSDASGYDNPYHVKELYRHEFSALLDKHWPALRWLGQKMAFFSLLWDEEKAPLQTVSSQILQPGSQLLENEITWPAVYHVVLAAKKNEHLPATADINLFADEPESVYGHYHAVIRAHIQAEEKLEQLKRALKTWQKIPVLGHWLKYLEKKHGI